MGISGITSQICIRVEKMDGDYQNTKGYSRKFVTDRWLEKFKKKGKGWLIITTSSMAPLIQPGDLVYIGKVAPSKINIGDIIAFWQGNILIIHRVIRKIRKDRELFFIERSDGYFHHSLVSSRSLMGKVLKIKKSEKSINMDVLSWSLFNRIIGIMFFSAFLVRIAGRKLYFVPKPLKNFIKKVYKTLGHIPDKLLEINFFLRK